MELGEVTVHPRVRIKLAKLIHILFEKEYFGFLDSAEQYVDSIYGTIFQIPLLKHFKTSNPKVGAYYIRHKANQHTTYYITFDRKGDRFLVRHIFSNHERGYSSYVRP